MEQFYLLNLKSYQTNQCEFKVNSLDTTEILKMKMEEKIGIPANQQRFYFKGSELVDRCNWSLMDIIHF